MHIPGELHQVSLESLMLNVILQLTRNSADVSQSMLVPKPFDLSIADAVPNSKILENSNVITVAQIIAKLP